MRLTSMIVAMLFIAITGASAKEQSYLFRPDGANFFVYGYGQNSFILNQSKLASLKLDSNITELSTAKRINSASDDPAGFAVAEKMKGLLAQLRQESVNDEDMRNLNNYIESAIAEDQALLQRVRKLLVQASGGIMNREDREYIQVEIDQFLKQIDFNARFSRFNTMAVIPELTARNLGLDGVDVVRNLQNSFELVDLALTKLTKKRVVQGVKSNILTFRIEGRSYHYLNLQRTESSISDLDMAEGITDLMKNSVQLKTQHGLILRHK